MKHQGWQLGSGLVVLLWLTTAKSAPEVVPATASSAVSYAATVSGLNPDFFDTSVRPQDDLYRFINGKWLDSVAIPADRARYGAFDQLTEAAEADLHMLVEALATQPAAANSEAQKIRDLYASFMNEARLETLGLQPLQNELKAIDKLSSANAISAHMAYLAQLGVNVPVVPYIHQDNHDSTRYAVDLYQAGLGLPDRDYYLQDGEGGAYAKIRVAYKTHVASMLTLAGETRGEQSAEQVISLETALAQVQWDKVVNRDPNKIYNKYSLRELSKLAPGFDWSGFMRATGVEHKVNYLLVSQPSYVTAYAQLLRKQSVQTWKYYLKWRVISEFAPYLSKRFVDTNFAFAGTTLRGIPENRPRWKRGLSLLEGSIGEGLGKLYVAKYFPPQNKQRMEVLVSNLLTAYRQSIGTLDWMSDATKAAAQTKLDKFTVKIGYPRQWRDYSTLQINADDLIGNVMRAQRFEYRRQVNKLGKPIDRDEWQMTPQTVNAYYNPELNEIVFPAAILQPPFFDANADDAANYGGIGAVIGHEISHGFDDQGSQYDGDGNLRDWWTPEDHAKFAAKTNALVAQYAAYEPAPGHKLNGELTLGENIADNSGLAIAYKAYQLASQGRAAPLMAGLTGEQRFYAGWAQVWRNNVRDQEIIRLVAVDPHSPGRFRAWGAAVNQQGFYQAFHLQPGDKMYLPPEQRVTIW
jgi:predicted metalloendopeptidase